MIAAPDDLRALLGALRRRTWLIVGLPLAAGLLTWLTYQPPAPTYRVRLSFAIDIPRSAIVPGSDEGTAAKIGEALIDDISRIIGGDVFAADVAARLPPEVAVSAGQIASTLSATDRHRTADVTVICRPPPADPETAVVCPPPGADPEAVAAVEAELRAVAAAVVAELEEDGGAWFARLGQDEVALTVYRQPALEVAPPPLRARLEPVLRVALALAVAVGLALAAHALDHRLYTPAAAANAAGAPVLGRIPSRRGGVLG